MTIPLTDEIKDLLDGPVFAHVATVGPDGHPQNTVMWIDRDGDRIILNTAEGRAKWHNMKRDPRLGISISPLDDPYVNYSLKGRIMEMRTSDGEEVIDRLAHKYLGVDEYPWRVEGQVRVTIEVAVEAVADNR
jgi:PPOX class probable F420-dependent enzyme